MKTIVQRRDTKDRAETAEQPLEAVIFSVGGQFFGLDIFRVAEITRKLAITALPRSLPFIEGIVNLRGRIIPVVDLRRRLGLPPAAASREQRVIIVRLERQRIGLLVDAVSRVAPIPRETIERVPPAALDIDAELIGGVGRLGETLVILLALDRMLTPQERRLLAGEAPGENPTKPAETRPS